MHPDSPTLENIGLSKQEAAVYLSTLELGSSPISNIAKKAGIKRPTTYNIMEGLITKSLITRVPKGKRTFYMAVPPQNLMSILRQREEQLMSALPRLESLQRSSPNKPKIRFYEGKEGISTIYREMFHTPTQMLALGSFEHIGAVFNEKDMAGMFKILREQGGTIKDLVEPSREAEAYLKQPYRKGMGPVKFLPADFKLATDCLIVGNKTSLVSYSNLMGLIIENDEIAQTQRQMFDFMWKHL